MFLLAAAARVQNTGDPVTCNPLRAGEGIVMCPVGRHELSLSPPSCSNPLSSEMAAPSFRPSSAQTAPIYFPQLPPKHTLTCSRNSRLL